MSQYMTFTGLFSISDPAVAIIIPPAIIPA